MIRRTLAASLMVVLSSPVWSFECFLTLVKDSCWTNYNVSVDVVDASTLQKLFTVTAPAGQSWAREKFACTPQQTLQYIASFNPIFWQNDEGKTYPGVRSWTLPAKVNPSDLAWTIPVCYSEEFSQVPLPPEAKGNCTCDFDSIPAPKPN
ncbi:hypothetical protein [Legionella shakespearei]|uniref:Periplasmic protein n=1 Tax=Legionella shakespearei DSM 23087 TaxID=1122169 RepID=A0A0W0Z123_9GAMM|nr:hypothetical protein [Legionella shakespearei]KTD62807.1 periplasmic protein [Legionella shakespearei DSM 23087]